MRDKDHAYTEFIGTVSVPTASIYNGNVLEGGFPILKKNKTQRGVLELRIEFVSKVAKRVIGN